MKSFRLDVDYDYDFDLYGVVSSSKEHTLAWALNKSFRLRLIKQADLCIDFLNKGRLVISNYLHSAEHGSLRLLRNRSVGLSTLPSPFLVPDIKEYDYVIQVSGSLDTFQQGLLQQLHAVPLVQYVRSFDPASLRYRENLLF
ncbi:IPExxxVDY family protein [Nibribacter ruber]|uniref:IPExxxVDY family protein n=1 Tax=Nibribacter ruber TaxID=2698458 RepID=A0A6P1P3Q3_9BACT|nr:IPExxxVDY family protein [Nibribacter ruber]QHL89013.1 IPExxxVDY family protein [Nibribacter ruber]